MKHDRVSSADVAEAAIARARRRARRTRSVRDAGEAAAAMTEAARAAARALAERTERRIGGCALAEQRTITEVAALDAQAAEAATRHDLTATI
jgi:hypothetical protein